jgi:hypothetical protein
MVGKKVFLGLLVLLFSIPLFAQSKCQDTIEIKAVNFRIKTFFSVSCSGFEKSFSSEVKLNKVCNSDTLALFRKLVKNSKKSKEKIDTDVRVKINFLYGNDLSSSILCMDKFGNIIFNDILVKKNKKLMKLIKACLPEGIL